MSGADGATRLLVVSADELIDIAGDRVSRGFTAEQCQRYSVARYPGP